MAANKLALDCCQAAGMTVMKAALDGLTTGLGNAADAYRRTDRMGHGPR